MIHLIYISSATSWPSEEDLLFLLEQARARNLRQHITGMLLYSNATYLQVLEGAEKDVHEIFGAIGNDERNTGIVKLREARIVQRDFPDWTMGFKNLDQSAPDDVPGFVDTFNGKLDKRIAASNQRATVNLLMNFVNRGSK